MDGVGAGSQHGHLVGDTVFAATFLLDGMPSSMGRIDALSHWVASDHFEELGRPQRLGHGGFGLLTVGNLRKPRWWALELLERLGDDVLVVVHAGDGGGGLVSAWPPVGRRHARQRAGVLVWNSSPRPVTDAVRPVLAREVTVRIEGMAPGAAQLTHHRVDEEHSNVFAAWRDLGGADRDWPEGDEWDQLRERDGLAELEPARTVDVAADGVLQVSFTLPHPGISSVTITT